MRWKQSNTYLKPRKFLKRNQIRTVNEMSLLTTSSSRVSLTPLTLPRTPPRDRRENQLKDTAKIDK